ncbi:MAG: HIT family protein [Bacteroidetes bacterium]|nr:HIT family protein [Bacteroidota bacterium]
MPSIFSKIIAGEIRCHKIGETTNCFAFLDVFPLVEGHVLVVPKKEVDYLFDLDDELLAEINLFSKKIAKAIEKVISCKRIGVAVIGLEVPHAHIHLVPLNNISDINFSRTKLKPSAEELAAVAEKIRAALQE